MKRGKLLKTTFVTLMVCATAGTLFACRGKPVTYKVVYTGGDGSVGEAPAEATYEKDAKFNLADNTFTKEGYTFVGWSDGTSTYLEGVEYTMGEADVTFTAQWEETTAPVVQKYTVTYNKGEHAAPDASVPTAVTVDEGSEVTLPAALGADSGYEFAGWQVGSDIKNAGDKITVTAHVTVTALWQSNGKLTVTYELGDHASTDASIPTREINLDPNAEITLPKAPRAALGYEFTGWKVGSDTELKAAGAKVTVTATVSVVAQWKQSVYTVTYGLGEHAATGATAPEGATEKHYGDTITLPAAPEAAAGYTFAGWQLGDDSANLKAAETEIELKGSLTITAAWTQNEYTVTYVLGSYAADGVEAPAAVTGKHHGDRVTLPAAPAAKEDYEFIGWQIGSDSDVEKLKQAEEEIEITATVTVTARWKAVGSEGPVEPEPTEEEITDYVTAMWSAHPKLISLTKGEETTIVATLSTSGTVEAYTGLGLDVHINNDYYRIRPDAQVFTDSGSNTWGTDREEVLKNLKLEIDATSWDLAKYQGLYAEGASMLQVVSVIYEEGLLTITVANYAGTDTELATPVASATYKITCEANEEPTIGLWVDGGAACSKATMKVELLDASNYVKLTLVNGEEDSVESNVKIGAEYTFGADPVKEHYVFGGWKSSDAEDTKLYKAGDKLEIEAALTFTAQWTKAKYAVTYDVGDHAAASAEAPTEAETEYEDEITLAAAPAAEEGYEFSGWQVNDAQALAAVGAKVSVTGVTTITAVYKLQTITVSFNVGEHAEEGATVASVSGDWGTEIDLPVAPAAETGYTFAGWKIGDSTVPGSGKYTLKTNVTAIAQWNETANSYVVHFVDSDGTTLSSDMSVEKDAADKTITLPTPAAKAGYKFLGWHLQGEETLVTTATVEVSDNATYVAKWQAVYTVTVLDDLAGNPVAGAKTEYNGETAEKFVAPTTPEKEGYTFGGWFKVVEGAYTGNALTADTDIDGDMTIAAKWTIKTYTVTLKIDGQNDQELTVEHGAKLSEVENYEAPAKDYYRFDGWKAATGDAILDPEITAEVTLTAQFTQVEDLPSDNQEPTADTPITIAPTGYEANPIWVGKLSKGQIVSFTGTMAGGPSNWNTATMFIYSGLTAWGNFRIDNFVNYGSWAKNGNNDQLDISNVTEENWQVVKYNIHDWVNFPTIITNCNIQISYDWTNEGYILVTCVLTADSMTSAQIYMIAPNGATFEKDTYSIGFAGDTSTTTITNKTVSTTAPAAAAAPAYSDNQTPTTDTPIEYGTADNVLGYTALTPAWNGKIEKGEKVVMTGTMTSAAAENYQTAILYFYAGGSTNHNLRGDEWVNAFGELDGKFLIAPYGWDITRVSDIDGATTNWDVARAIFANCDVEFTFDFSNAKKCVVTFKAIGKDGDAAGKVYTCAWTYVMRSGADMQDLNYSIGLGGEAIHVVVTNIERTPAAD